MGGQNASGEGGGGHPREGKGPRQREMFQIGACSVSIGENYNTPWDPH